MRGATNVDLNGNAYDNISIHAPHAGRDGNFVIRGILSF